MFSDLSIFRFSGRVLVVAAVIAATLAVAPAIGAQSNCEGAAVTVDLALGQAPTEGDDVILGTDGDDVINGLGGNDVICGEDGNDTINAGNGADTVFAGAGDDEINAGQGRDTIYGQGGDDNIVGGKGKDNLNGGGGDDDIRGNNGTDTISGGAGDDFINGGQKADLLNGDNGNDTIIGGVRPDIIDGGNGIDLITGGGGQDRCVEDPRDLSAACEIFLPTAPRGDVAGGDFPDDQITVAVVNNGATDSIQRFTPDFFTAETGIEVEFLNLPELELRERVTLAAGTGSAEFDAFMISPFEAPQFGVNGWIQDLTPLAEADADYNVDDLLDPIRGALSLNGELYGVPFYGESSFVMFNQEIMDAAGIDFPAQPTWEEIAEIAEAVDTDDVAGICLRGLAGWGDLGASLTTVVNTFGGTWWEANADGTPGEAQINQADSGFRAATEFYVDLVQNFGQDDAANTSFFQCLELMQSGGAAMWYDATVAAGFLENEGLTGNLGVAMAPTGPADLPGGWLWTWGFAIPENAENTAAAWEFISWATSEEYINVVGENDGWAAAPPGSRVSTYENPDYIAATESFSDVVLDQILLADPNNPGLTPRPGLPGVQYVGIPEFPDIGTRCTQEISATIAGQQSLDIALDACQAIASRISQ